MNGPVVLVGLMGSGKTSVGRVLARRLGVPLLDLDLRLERRFGQRVAVQFERVGEAEFRRRESRELAQCLGRPSVVSTGGGVVLRPENRRRLKANVTVYLQASPRLLEPRLVGPQSLKRPLLKGKSVLPVLQRLSRERSGLYRSVASFTVRASFGDADAVAQRILVRLKELC